MKMKKSTIKYPFLTKDVEIYKLENGHTIVLAHKEGGLVNVSSWVKTGSINEDDKIVLNELVKANAINFFVDEYEIIYINL